MNYEEYLHEFVGECGVFQICMLIICAFSIIFCNDAVLQNYIIGDQVNLFHPIPYKVLGK